MRGILARVRPSTLLLLLLLVGGGLAWLFLDGPGAPRGGSDPTLLEGEQLAPEDRHLLASTGTLVIRVTAPDGSVPDGAEVGYAWRGHTRLLYAGEDGRRAFADAPLGDLMIVARAVGYEEARSLRSLIAGVPTEVHLVVQPTRGEDE